MTADIDNMHSVQEPDDPIMRVKGTKTRDTDGTPLLVFRGTGEGDDDRMSRRFWTCDPEAAQQYAEHSDGEDPHVFSAYLLIRRPMDQDDEKNARKLAKALGRTRSPDDPVWELIDDYRAADAVQRLGFDGLVFQDLNTSTGYNHSTYVSLEDDQVILVSKEKLGDTQMKRPRPR